MAQVPNGSHNFTEPAEGKLRALLESAQTERLFGYSRDDLLGQSVEVFAAERFRRKEVNL
jgi:hypothetical protein